MATRVEGDCLGAGSRLDRAVEIAVDACGGLAAVLGAASSAAAAVHVSSVWETTAVIVGVAVPYAGVAGAVVAYAAWHRAAGWVFGVRRGGQRW